MKLNSFDHNEREIFLFSIDASTLSFNQCAAAIFDCPVLNASPGAAYEFDLQYSARH